MCKKAVESIDGVISSDITVGTAKVVFDEDKASKDSILTAVNNAGYTVTN